MNTHVVIMAGGIGSRLWPLSTPDVPKQFIDVLGVGRSLLQLTVDRFAPVCQPEDFWVVTGEKYVDLVRQQLPDVPESQILAEPEGRNTAPCIAYASWKIQKKDPKANIVVTPADALVMKTAEFAETIAKAVVQQAGVSNAQEVSKDAKSCTMKGTIQGKDILISVSVEGDNFYCISINGDIQKGASFIETLDEKK